MQQEIVLDPNSNPPVLHRNAQVRKVDNDRTVELSFSSETPCERWFGLEVLGHDAGEVDTSRLDSGAAVLVNHDTSEIPVAVVESTTIANGRGTARIRFGESSRAEEVFKEVQAGVLRHVSVGYFVREMELTKSRDDGPDEYRVTRWEPFEISLVSVPADISVGVGREDERIQFMRYFEMPDKQTRSQAIATKSNPAVLAERERVEELTKTGEVYGVEELAAQFIQSGASVEDLNKAILERRGLQPTKAEDPSIGLTDAEVGRYSIIRAINAKLDPDNFARHAGFELEVSRAVEQQSGRELRGNLHIPNDILIAQRDLTVGVAADGGNLVGTVLDANSFIDLLRNALAMIQLGATHLPGLVGNVAIPRQAGAEATFWLGENGAPTESQASFDQVTLTPTTVGAYSELSRRLLKQATPYAEILVLQSLAQSVGLAVDLAAINGSGTGDEPLGILNTSGIGDVAGGANGAAPDWDNIVDLESAVAVANADTGSVGYLTNAKVRGKCKRTFVDAGSGQRIWDTRAPQTPLNGNRAVVSNQVPSDLVKGTSGAVCSAIIFGNWSDLIIGMWGGLDLQVNPYSLDTTGAVRITAFQDVDIAVRHAESFAAMQDALTA